MRIGIDFDDVVADSSTAIIEIHNKTHATSFKKDDFRDYLWENIWGGTREDRIKEIDKFLTADQSRTISPIAGSFRAIEELKMKGHELYIITGRGDKHIEQTELWIRNNFPNVFDGIYYTNSQMKSETCKNNGVKVLIDDNPEVALECAKDGIRVFIFDQPWNRGCSFPANVERVVSWDEMVGKLC
jgi:uncharacterized HAD superfamily protein